MLTRYRKRAVALLLAVFLMAGFLQLPVYASPKGDDASGEQGTALGIVPDDANSPGQWTLENNVLRAVVEMQNGSVDITSFYNKVAGVEYLTGTGQRSLFNYTVRKGTESTLHELSATSGKWQLAGAEIREIELYDRVWGDELLLTLQTADPVDFEVTLRFELYNGNAGLRYQQYVKNGTDETLTIKSSDIIQLDFAEQPHTAHYTPVTQWASTTGKVQNQRNCVMVYNTGDGWCMAPELNWMTNVSATNRNESDFATDTQRPPFGGVYAWDGDDSVRFSTNPTSLQLVLFPQEKFEYLAVNLTVFKGDDLDGRAANEDHFKQRFKYWNPTTISALNDWEWRGNRTEAYYRNSLVPALESGGFERVNVDDRWNTNEVGSNEVNLDGVIPIASFTDDLASLSQHIIDGGKKIGYWFSPTGNVDPSHPAPKQRNFADWSQVELKYGQMQDILIGQYNASWSQIDLKQTTQVTEITPYSHPSDSVYRNTVNLRNYMEMVTHNNPDFTMHTTNELDFGVSGFRYGGLGWSGNPRNPGLMHIPDNGTTSLLGGRHEDLARYADGDFRTVFDCFGHLPMDSMFLFFNRNYFQPNSMAEMVYQFPALREATLYMAPATLNNATNAIGLRYIKQFNEWRANERIENVLNSNFRPVSMEGPIGVAPAENIQQSYAYMYVTGDKTQAMLFATDARWLYGNNAANYRGDIDGFTAEIRWLDDDKTYLVEDVTIYDDTSSADYLGFTYDLVKVATGAQLKQDGLYIDYTTNKSDAKAYWIQEVTGEAMQIAYADHNVKDYAAAYEDGALAVRLQGSPDTEVSVVVFNRLTEQGAVYTTLLDGDGNGELVAYVNDTAAEKGALLAALEQAGSYTREMFGNEQDWAALQAAIAAGQLVYQDPGVGAKEVKEAVAALAAAMANTRQPLPPVGFRVVTAGTSWVTLEWEKNPDEVLDVAYTLHYGGKALETAETGAEVTGLSPDTLYTFVLRADSRGLASEDTRENTLQVATAPSGSTVVNFEQSQGQQVGKQPDYENLGLFLDNPMETPMGANSGGKYAKVVQDPLEQQGQVFASRIDEAPSVYAPLRFPLQTGDFTLRFKYMITEPTAAAQWLEVLSGNNGPLISLNVVGDTLYRRAGSSNQQVFTQTLALNEWHQFEINLHFGDTVENGSYDLKVDGTLHENLPFRSQGTLPENNAVIFRPQVGAANLNRTYYLDDIELPGGSAGPALLHVVAPQPIQDQFEITAEDLPATVQAIVFDGEKAATASLPVRWEMSGFDGDSIEEQIIEGTVDTGEAYANPYGLGAWVKVTLLPKKTLVSVASLANIRAYLGTELAELGLPQQVSVTLDDDSVVLADVTWDDGTPTYEKNTEGSYTFTGALTCPGASNPEGIKAEVTVVLTERMESVDLTTLDWEWAYAGVNTRTTPMAGDRENVTAAGRPKINMRANGTNNPMYMCFSANPGVTNEAALRSAADTVLYEKGIGISASGEIVYKIDSQFDRFTCVFGLDTYTYTNAARPSSVQFKIMGAMNDRSEEYVTLYDSGVMYNSDKGLADRPYTPPKDIDVSIAGYTYLKLWLYDAGESGAGGTNPYNASDDCIIAQPMLYAKATPQPVEKAALTALVEEAGALEQALYTPDSWAALAEALKVADVVLNDENVTQQDVDGAAEALDRALKALEKADPGEGVAVEALSISGPGSLKRNKSVTLEAVITPTDATDQNVTWEVLNPTVATITPEGVLTAGSKTGFAIVQVTAHNGVSAQIMIEITA